MYILLCLSLLCWVGIIIMYAHTYELRLRFRMLSCTKEDGNIYYANHLRIQSGSSDQHPRGGRRGMGWGICKSVITQSKGGSRL